MSKLILNPEYHLYEKEGKPFCDSLMVAETFGKEHKNVTRDIENLDCSSHFNTLNFERINYRDSRNRKQEKYLMTKDGFTFLVMGYRGKKAAKFKEAYIQRFNDMEQFIKSLYTAKTEFPAFTAAVLEAHEEPKHYHFSNEINMIYRIVLGMDAKAFRELHGIEKGAVIRPYLSEMQIGLIESLQRMDIGLLISVSDFQSRKQILENQCAKLMRKRLITAQAS